MKFSLKQEIPKFTELIVFDPGGTTGYAKLNCYYETNSLVVTEIGEFQTWEKVEELIKYAWSRPHVGIVYEGFRLRVISAVLIPVEVIGVIRFLCLKLKVPHFEQLPHERKLVDTWYQSNMAHFPSHYGSAVRHGIFFAVKNLFNNSLPKLGYSISKLTLEMENRNK